MKKIYTLLLFLALGAAGSIVAKPAPDHYIARYDIMDLDFLRSRYTEINNGRPIQIDGLFKSLKWIPPHTYKERLNNIGFNVGKYHVLQMTLKEHDDFHYSFPVLLFHTEVGDLQELEQLEKGDRVVIYGRFYNLKQSEYALEVDYIETLKKGGHNRDLLLESHVNPTFTPTWTITNTPGPNLWQKLNNKFNPKETPTPTGTITPEVGK